MEEIDVLAQGSRRERRAKAMRMKQLVGSFSTLGYAGVAGDLYEPVLKHQPLRLEHIGATLPSIVAIGVAIWLAPATEVDDGRI